MQIILGRKTNDLSTIFWQYVKGRMLATWRGIVGWRNAGIGQLRRYSERLNVHEFRRLSYVHALWACRCHPYIESLLTLR